MDEPAGRGGPRRCRDLVAVLGRSRGAGGSGISQGGGKRPLPAPRYFAEQVADFLEAVDRIITLERLADLQLDSIWTVRLAAADGCRPIGKGVNASPGVAVGEAVFQPAAAVALSSSGRIGWLARKFTPPE